MAEKIDISIVIPSFNEARHLPLFLDKLIPYCKGSKYIYEIIVIDDGSTDATSGTAASYKGRFQDLTIIRNEKNNGKGYSVKKGLMASKGRICLFMDADGATGPEEIERNLHYLLEDGYDIFVGSRVLKDKEQVLIGKWYRKFIGIVFNFFVQALLFKNIKDTQCGFKMFKKEVIEPLFSRSYIRGFGFDIEILYLAYKMGYRVKEGAISWHHVSGSKVNLLTDSIRMFFNILQTRIWHCTPINRFAKYMGPDEYRYMYEMEDYHWWFVSRRNFLLHLIGSLKILFPTILDVGSGTGSNLKSFSKFGKAFGIDASREAVEFCIKRGLKDVSWGKAEKIAYADKTFSIITCIDVLEHVPRPVEALQELKRVLRDDGRLIITVPAFRLLWSRHDEALCHLRRYERESLSHDVHEAGFEIESIGYFFFVSFFAVAPIRILRRFFLSSKQKARSDTTTLPPKFLNEFLKFLFKVETKITDKFKLPVGTTLYAVVRKSGP